MLTEALKWIRLGIAVFPMQYRSKYPIGQWGEFQNRLPTEQELKKWFEHRHRNMAIIPGREGLTILDFDSFEMFGVWLNWAIDKGDEAGLLAQYSIKTITKRGVHVFAMLPQPVNCRNFAMVEGPRLETFNQKKHSKDQLINIKGRGGYVVAPPSVHPEGHIYQYLDSNAPILSASSLEAILPPIVEANTEHGNIKPITIDPWQSANQTRQSGGSSITKIKQQFPILTFFPNAQASGPEWFKDHCRFHPHDSHTSLMIKPAEGFCICKTCGNGKTWDVINVYAKLQNISNSEAIAQLGQLVK